MSSDRIRQLVTVLAFLVTVAVNGAANGLPINGQLTAEISDRFPVYVIPAGYVFAIRDLIYLALASLPSTRPCRRSGRTPCSAVLAGCQP
jgi:hypothetical protein